MRCDHNQFDGSVFNQAIISLISNFPAEHHKVEFGTVGQTFECYQSSKVPHQVAQYKTIHTADIVHAIIWPCLGTDVTVFIPESSSEVSQSTVSVQFHVSSGGFFSSQRSNQNSVFSRERQTESSDWPSIKSKQRLI